MPRDQEETPIQPTADTLLPPIRCIEATKGPPQRLAQLSNTALRNSPLAREAWAGAQRAAAEHGRVLSQYYPTVAITAEGGFGHFLFQFPTKAVAISQWEFQPLATLNWMLLDFGRRDGQARETFEEVLAANLTFNRELQDIVYAVQTGYYKLQAAKAMVIAAETSLEQAVTVRTAAERRLNAGLATRPEFLLAKRVEAKAIYDLENAVVLVTDSEADLALTLGLPATCIIPIDTTGNSALPAAIDEGVDRLVDVALAQRPDLGAHVAKVRAQDAVIETARAQFLPQLSVTGQYGFDFWSYHLEDAPDNQIKSVQPNYEVMLNFKWDVFVGFERENTVRAAVASREVASAQLEEAGLGAIAEVWKAYYRVRAARKRFGYAEALLAASSDAYASVFESYNRGLSTIVELLDADRDLAQSRFILVQSRAELLIETATLTYSVGTIFAGKQVPTPAALAAEPMPPAPPPVVETMPPGGPAEPPPPRVKPLPPLRGTQPDPSPSPSPL